MLKQLWNDEAGAILSAETVLVATILVIGLVTGLSSLRDGVIEELADVGKAIGNVDQSYTVGGSVSHSAATSNFGFTDQADFCDLSQGTNGNSRCLVITSVSTVLTGADGNSGQ